jgi:Ca2+-binding RTX toxin-like protein
MVNIVNGRRGADVIGPVKGLIPNFETTDGEDIIFGNTGLDKICGMGGDDEISGGDGRDWIDGGSGNDNIQGDGANYLGDEGWALRGWYRGGWADYIRGGEGDDIVDGNGGDDKIWGEEGDDNLLGSDGNDTVDGGTGNDLIVGGNPEKVYLAEISASLEGWYSRDDDLLFGDEGNDTVDGGYGDDSISGGTGDDDITGGLGDDDIAGDDGNDTIDAGWGYDDISGGAGNDSIDAGGDDDCVHGDDGNDNLNGGAGSDIILGGAGNDTIQGDGAIEVTKAEASLEEIAVPVESYNDKIDGGEGRDLIDGGWGDDIIAGGADRDRMTGGEGNDAFVFREDENDGVRDVITDFDYGDKIVFCGQDEYFYFINKIDYIAAQSDGEQNDVLIRMSDGSKILVLNAADEISAGNRAGGTQSWESRDFNEGNWKNPFVWIDEHSQDPEQMALVEQYCEIDCDAPVIPGQLTPIDFCNG